jgi:hypothetical protein
VGFGPQFGGARLPNSSMILTKALACSVSRSGLHQYSRRAAVYRVNKVKRFVRPIHAIISSAEPREERHGRPTARHAHRSSVALELTDVSSFVNIAMPLGSLAPPSQANRLPITSHFSPLTGASRRSSLTSPRPARSILEQVPAAELRGVLP